MKTISKLIFILSLFAATAQAGSLSSTVELKYKQAFQVLQKKLKEQKATDSLLNTKGPQVIKLTDSNFSDDDNIGNDVVRVEPIRFNKGKFKLTRSYTDINDNYVYKEELICDGVFAVPVYDVRNEKDYYFDFSQTVNCFGLLDGNFANFQLGGIITLAKGEHPLDSSVKDAELKAFSAHMSANLLDSPINPPEHQDSSFWRFNSFATKELALNHALLTLDRGLKIKLCSEPPSPPIEPVEPLRPTSSKDDSNEEPTTCISNKDFVTLTVELVD